MTNSNRDRLQAELGAVAALAADFIARRRESPVAAGINANAIEQRLLHYRFDAPRPLTELAGELFELLGSHAVRNDHPRYFGLFNPPPLPAAVAGDLVAAAVNPQLAVWSHAPAALEMERRLLNVFGECIGWPARRTGGAFTAGGSEANQTALLAALARRYPEWCEGGLAAVSTRPAIYVSSEAHLAWLKIARMAGLGSDAVRLVPTADGLRLDGETLRTFIARDGGRDPALIVATAGATAHGAIDDMEGIAAVAREHETHFHVDAAWAGAVVLCDEARGMLAGIEAADSVTIDAHKWLSVPMGAGMYLARDEAPLRAAFDASASYMPSASRARRDPYIHSVQWSRRFTGLKLFMAMATLGRVGYAALIQRMIEAGDELRETLRAHGWRVLNETPLPLVCFVPARGNDDTVVRIAAAVVASGRAWISTVRVRGRTALRACITSYETTRDDIDALVTLLGEIRAAEAA